MTTPEFMIMNPSLDTLVREVVAAIQSGEATLSPAPVMLYGWQYCATMQRVAPLDAPTHPLPPQKRKQKGAEPVQSAVDVSIQGADASQA